MHAAILKEYGTPVYGEFDEPHADAGKTVVKVLAAGLNPFDVLLASGNLMTLALPRVAGQEGVGLMNGRRVYFGGAVAPFGSMAEQSLINPKFTMDVPEGVDDASAVSLGIAGLTAWLALKWRALLRPSEHVLVLGASGAVGMIAVQAAKLLGAGQVIAAARSEERLAEAKERGADATVPLGQSDEAFTTALRQASRGRLDIIIDLLWGNPALAAMRALTAGGRLVQIGSSAGGQVQLDPGFMRGPLVSILGFSSGSVPHADRAEAYTHLCNHVHAGEIKVDTETVPLADIEDAWQRQKSSPHRKLVLVP